MRAALLSLALAGCVPVSHLAEVDLGVVPAVEALVATPDAAIACTAEHYVRVSGGPRATWPRKGACGEGEPWLDLGVVVFAAPKGVDLVLMDWSGDALTSAPRFGEDLTDVSSVARAGADVWVGRQGPRELLRADVSLGLWSVALDTGARGPSRTRVSASGVVYWLFAETDALYRLGPEGEAELVWNGPVDGAHIDDFVLLGETLVAARPPALLVFEPGAAEPQVEDLALGSGAHLARGDGFVAVTDGSRVLVRALDGSVEELAAELVDPRPAALGRTLFVAHDGRIGRYDLP